MTERDAPQEPKTLTTELAERGWLQQFLAWIIPINFVSVLIEGYIYCTTWDFHAGVTFLILVVASVNLLIARRWVQQGRWSDAVMLVAISLLGFDTIFVFLQPWLSSLSIIPLLAITLSLPYIRGTALRHLMFWAWLTTALVTGVGLSASTPPEVSPFLLWVFRYIGLVSTLTLVMLLLWQFSNRLTTLLEQTHAAEAQYSRAAAGASDGLWDWDIRTGHVYFSPRWKEMLGYKVNEIGKTPNEWFKRIHDDDRARVEAEIAVHLDGLTPQFESEYRIRCFDGRYRWMLARGLAVRNQKGQAELMAGSQTDITRQKQYEAQLQRAALHDDLTGLPNRRHFSEKLRRTILQAKKDPTNLFAVLFLDLDHFKFVNDSMGHSVGDELLVAVGQRLQNCLRPTDTLARLGGDEFTILLEELQDEHQATELAARIRSALTQPFIIRGTEIFTSTSIGITLNSQWFRQSEEILRDADSALSHAKAQGKARWIVFDERMHTDAIKRLDLQSGLRRALSQREFVVYYQPIVTITGGELVGFESLIRWQHPERGLMYPDQFLPLAEETGLTAALDTFVLQEACRQMAHWRQQFPDQNLLLNANVSAQLFSMPDFVEIIQDTLMKTSLPAHSLRLELTESIIMINVPDAATRLQRLHDMGVVLHVDDFGTGYSSLSKLHQFPIDGLKIDRMFMARVIKANDHVPIIETIMSLAQSMGITVTAEGVETAEQLAYLQDHNCHFGQGYFFAMPLNALAASDICAGDVSWKPYFEQNGHMTYAETPKIN